jgi:4-hydroxysphinganine ceramide fatty acyl 2-hydroxylase
MLRGPTAAVVARPRPIALHPRPPAVRPASPTPSTRSGLGVCSQRYSVCAAGHTGLPEEAALSTTDNDPTPAPATPAAALATFATHPTPRAVAALLLVGAAARGLLAATGACPLTPSDAGAAAAAAAGWVAAEPGLHALLHAGDWPGARVHAAHHAAPYHHLSIDPPGLVLSWIGAVAALAAGAVSLGGAPPGPALTALLAYAAAGLAYEGVHFTAHCPFTPASAWGRALKAHHVRHHLHSEAHWLAFQAPFLDGWVGRGGGSVRGVVKGPMAVAAGEAAVAAAAAAAVARRRREGR